MNTYARGHGMLVLGGAVAVLLLVAGITVAFQGGALHPTPPPSPVAVASVSAPAATSSPSPSPSPTPVPSPTLPPAGSYPLVDSCVPSSVPWATPVTTPAAAKPGSFVLHVPILMYHRIVPFDEAGNSIRGLVVPPEVFSAQLDALQSAGWHTITMAQLGADMQAHIQPAPKTFVITIDDGWDDGYTYALPVLQSHGFVATYFVVAGRIDIPDFLSSAHLQALIAAGDEIGDHTMDHANLARQTASKLTYQIDAAAARIAQVTGVWPQSLAYPSGGVDDAAAAGVAACGEMRTAVIEGPPEPLTASPTPKPLPSPTAGPTAAPIASPASGSSAAPGIVTVYAALATSAPLPPVYESWATRWTIPRLRVTPNTVPTYLLAELSHYA